jgi:hypothetical protein
MIRTGSHGRRTNTGRTMAEENGMENNRNTSVVEADKAIRI